MSLLMEQTIYLYIILNICFMIFAFWRDMKNLEYSKLNNDAYNNNFCEEIKEATIERIDEKVDMYIMSNDFYIKKRLHLAKLEATIAIHDLEAISEQC